MASFFAYAPSWVVNGVKDVDIRTVLRLYSVADFFTVAILGYVLSPEIFRRILTTIFTKFLVNMPIRLKLRIIDCATGNSFSSRLERMRSKKGSIRSSAHARAVWAFRQKM